MTDARDENDVNVAGSGDLPEGITEEFREITDEDLASVGTDRTTMGEASGGIEDLDDDLDDDLTPLEDKDAE